MYIYIYIMGYRSFRRSETPRLRDSELPTDGTANDGRRSSLVDRVSESYFTYLTYLTYMLTYRTYFTYLTYLTYRTCHTYCIFCIEIQENVVLVGFRPYEQVQVLGSGRGDCPYVAISAQSPSCNQAHKLLFKFSYMSSVILPLLGL